jgi:hypothetical protein
MSKIVCRLWIHPSVGRIRSEGKRQDIEYAIGILGVCKEDIMAHCNEFRSAQH